MRYGRGPTTSAPAKKRAPENTAPSGCARALPASRFIILRVRHLSHSIAQKRNAVRVSKWLCARRKQSFAIRACWARLRERRVRVGISGGKNGGERGAEDRGKPP